MTNPRVRLIETLLTTLAKSIPVGAAQEVIDPSQNTHQAELFDLERFFLGGG